MDQILANLADAVPDTFTDVSGEETELPGEISDVMQAFECVATTPDPKLEPISVDLRLEKAAEKQTFLQSRHRNLQMRINRLRAQKLSCNARDVLCSVVTSCDKRRARMNGDVSVEPKLGVKVELGTETETPKKMRVKKYDKGRTDEVLGQLHSQLRHVQSYLDPDATESSSGGESADETDKFQAGAELYAPLQERAKYRWHSRRAQLASQWVWLQAQVSDLEYKIRQSTDGYRAQRLGKGSVQLGEEVISWPLHAKVPTLPQGAAGDSLPLSCPVPTKVYGAPRDHEDTGSTDDEASMTCCRVRPVKRVRRRKLVDTHGLHHTVARAAKLSSVSCECLRPGQWCVLCTGRRSHSLSVSGTPERRGSRQETVALLDHSYHTVLSQPGQDTQLGLVLMESLANRKWLVRHTNGLGPVTPGQPAHLSKLMNINNKDNKDKNFKDNSLSLKRKYMKRKDKDGKVMKKRRKYDSERDPESRPDSPDQMIGGPVVGDLNIKAVRDGVERIRDKMAKKRKSSYDIDHIVIPMSMAATTRVERIKYKEILTPSWRETAFFKTDTDEKPEPEEVKQETVKEEKQEETKEEHTKEIKEEVETPPTDEEEDDFEDITELAYRLRHVKAEEEERVRWATPLGRTHGGQRGHNQTSSGRSGRGRRLDSCRTEASSGANTPMGPLSPGAIEDIMVATRPSSPSGDHTPTVTSPPPPPELTSPASMASPPSISCLMPTPLSSVPASVRGRRRTSSQTKSRDRNLSEASQHSQESSRASSPWTEVEERAFQAWSQPWEMRTFPLTDEEVKEIEKEDRLMLSRTKRRSEHAAGHVDSSVVTRETRVTGSRDTCPESVESSRATSRSVEVRLVKLRTESVHSRSSSICLEPPDQESASEPQGLVDPDWAEDHEDTEEDEVKDEAVADEDDPEYDPEAGDLNSHKTS